MADLVTTFLMLDSFELLELERGVVEDEVDTLPAPAPEPFACEVVDVFVVTVRGKDDPVTVVTTLDGLMRSGVGCGFNEDSAEGGGRGTPVLPSVISASCCSKSSSAVTAVLLDVEDVKTSVNLATKSGFFAEAAMAIPRSFRAFFNSGT